MKPDNPFNPNQPFDPDGNNPRPTNATRPARSGRPASRPTQANSLRSSGLNAEVNQLRQDMFRITSPTCQPTDLQSAAAILKSVSDTLLNIIQLLQTHQALRAGGEPIAQELEYSLQQISSELTEEKFRSRMLQHMPPDIEEYERESLEADIEEDDDKWPAGAESEYR